MEDLLDFMAAAGAVREKRAAAEIPAAEPGQDVALARVESRADTGRGLWGPACTVTGQVPVAPVAPVAPAEPQGQCDIKGNINREGERIYHVPGQRYYDDTVISEERGERWFCSEGEAREAGWRKAKV